MVRRAGRNRNLLINHSIEFFAGKEVIMSLKKDGDISEDDLFNYQDEVQKLTDKYIQKTDSVLAAKEKEIMEI